MLTATAIMSIKSFIRDSVAFAKYRVGGTYYQAEIRSTYIMDDGRVAFTFLIDHTIPGTITVTEVQLYDRNGVLWATKAESITRKDLQEGILYRFAFTITES